ncbi:Oidioi.mRNA.OKI2018_I69.chr1.g3711.t1.cds [Oikopleura dioica]|uniref:Oidioi.mRNA.OKI2018_I69.chr1.g3711.t1.cds n=1 Tax=Oikopleura dioica TaxID=34765 RepID=A0ABN7T0J0_OIKDI|nr:Oidioi.mRNA.OKI2018_I69.chr1.g3711.t1.cds [Oikopleura dioica]
MDSLLAQGFDERMLAQMFGTGGTAGLDAMLGGSAKSFADPGSKTKSQATTKKEYGSSIKQEPKSTGYGSYGSSKTTTKASNKNSYGSVPMAGATSTGWGSSASTQQAARTQNQTFAYGNGSKNQTSYNQNQQAMPKAMPRGAADVGTKLQAISTAAEHYRLKCKRKILGRKALFRLEEIIAFHIRTGMSEFSDRHDMDIFAQLAEQVLLIIARAHAKAKIDELQQIASPEGFSFYTSSRNRWVLKNLQTLFQRYPCQEVKDRLLDAQHFEKSLYGVLHVVSYK